MTSPRAGHASDRAPAIKKIGEGLTPSQRPIITFGYESYTASPLLMRPILIPYSSVDTIFLRPANRIATSKPVITISPPIAGAILQAD